ncbi:MAG: hypothetical protein KDA24_14175 [Deltaproteobacteria bacterium]|nr:hypothetical protein [Deltaproteobacteria bacterium]
MSLKHLFVCAAGAALLTGCPTGDGDLADLTFDPAVDDRGNATIDIGDVEVGTNPPPSATIIVTNNTDEEVSVGVDCDDIAGTPFNISCPAELLIPAAGSDDNTRPIGGTLLVGPNDVGSVQASIFFDYDDRVYAFILLANVVQ